MQNPLKFPHTVDVLLNKYARDKDLRSIKLSAFKCTPQIQKLICPNEEVLKEHQKYIAELFAFRDFEEDSDSLDEFVALSDERDRIAAETGNLWESELTQYLRDFDKLRRTEFSVYNYYTVSYRAETRRRFEDKEVPLFTQGCDELIAEASKKKSFPLSYKYLMEQLAPKHGFYLDKKRFRKKNHYVFSKDISEKCTISICNEYPLLDTEVEETTGYNHTTGEITRMGPFYDPYLSFSILLEESENNPIVKTVSFRELFPLQEFDRIAYAKFYSVLELCALIQIYLSLYDLISNELESALLADIQSLRNQ